MRRSLIRRARTRPRGQRDMDESAWRLDGARGSEDSFFVRRRVPERPRLRRSLHAWENSRIAGPVRSENAVPPRTRPREQGTERRQSLRGGDAPEAIQRVPRAHDGIASVATLPASRSRNDCLVCPSQ